MFLLISHSVDKLTLLLSNALRTMYSPYTQGGRSMVYECAQIADRMLDAEAAGDEKAAKQLDSRLGFLTPILKGFLTEAGKEAADLGIQVYGGHGYIQVVFGRTHAYPVVVVLFCLFRVSN